MSIVKKNLNVLWQLSSAKEKKGKEWKMLKGETQYIAHKMLSQGRFCKILKFVIGHVIKYSWLG